MIRYNTTRASIARHYYDMDYAIGGKEEEKDSVKEDKRHFIISTSTR